MFNTWETWKAAVEAAIRESTRQRAVYYGDAIEEWWRARFRCNYAPEAAIYELEWLIYAAGAHNQEASSG